MNILGIDPGRRSGWALYNADAKRVFGAGQFDGADFSDNPNVADVVVIERPVGYGPTRPELVDCGFIAGQIYERATNYDGDVETELLTRLEVCKILTAAVHGVIRVRNDATAWAALKELHGDGCDKKGGPLYGVKSHARAALAVCVAWANRELLAAVAP